MKSLIFFFASFSFLALATFNCNSITDTHSDSIYMDYDHVKVPYKLYAPDAKFALHHDLEEISGLSMYGNDLLMAVEDEKGYVYLLDPKNGKIVRKIKFAKSGDYEGVEFVNGRVYVIKSNGNIFSFEISDGDEEEADEVDTELSSGNDVEGLAALGKHLLIACKGKGEIDDNKVKGKAVYAYDMEKKKLGNKNIFNLDEDDIEDFIKGRKFFNKIHSFDPSAIAVHPLTSEVYWLSGDRVLVVLTPDYQLKEVVRLNGDIYRQPEGICFAEDGTMYISSEGDGAKGKIFKINYMSY